MPRVKFNINGMESTTGEMSIQSLEAEVEPVVERSLSSNIQNV